MTRSSSSSVQALFLSFVVLCGHTQLRAQSTTFAYQGRLKEGTNSANGSYDFKFSLFGTNIGGIAVAGPQTNFAVQADGGLFNVLLDFGAGVFTGDDRWLDISVRAGGTEDFVTLSPRQPITRTPYAIQAANALNVTDGSITSAKLSPSPGVNGQVLKMNGGALSWGIDNDTHYSAGAGLNLAGSTFNIAFAGSGTNNQAARSDHKHPIEDFVSGILTVEQGGTGASSASNALANLGGASLAGSNFFGGANMLLNGANQFAGAFSGDGSGLSNLNVRTTIIASNELVLSFDPAHFGVSDGSNVFIRRGALLANPIVASGTITGDGSGLTNLNADQLETGIVPLARGGTGAGTAPNALANLGGASLSESNLFSGVNTMLNPANRFAGSFRGNGTFLLGVDAEHLIGTLQSAQLAGTYSGAVRLNNPSNFFAGAFSGDGSDLLDLNAGNLSTGLVPILRGGTGAGTVAGARANLGAAGSGANADITSLHALSTPLSIPQGGTGASSASNALVNLGGASLAESNLFSGVNAMVNAANQFVGTFNGDGSNLTSLDAGNITTGLIPMARGGTGAATPAGARANLGAAASGANADITSLNGLSGPISVSQGGTGANTSSNALANLGGASLAQSNLFAGVNIMLNASNRFTGTFNGDGSSLSGLEAGNITTGLIPLERGGTGASTPAGARASLGAAASGANADITSLNGLSGPISVSQGGTGASTATNGLMSLGGASLTRSNRFAGANVMTNAANRFVGSFTGDGSNLTGLDPENFSSTVPVTRGGTSADTPFGARLNLGAAASGANTDITSLNSLTTPLSVTQGGTGGNTASNGLRNLGGASLTRSNLFTGVNAMLHPANQFAGAFSGDGHALNNVNAAALGGLTPSAFWRLGGNSSTTVGDFLGTTDNQPLELRVNGAQALRLEPNAPGAPTVIAAGAVAIGTNNPASRALFVNGTIGVSRSNVLEMGVGIAGKHVNAGKIGYQTFTPGALDIVGAGSNAVSRRIKFWAEGGATFSGTGTNPAVVVANTVDDAAAISFSAPFSTWRVGQNKPPDAPGAFDSFFVYQQSVGATRLLITDTGRVGLGTNNPTHPLHLANGAYCTAGGVWTSVSDRNAKQDFRAIEPREVLAKVATLPITKWKYKAETNGVEHLGPTAQDFHSAFGLGESDKAIGAIDADGVALAAIQGLNQVLHEKETEIRALVEKNRQMEERLQKLETALRKMIFAER